MYTEQITERLGLATPIHPQILNNATVNTGGVDMSKFHRAFFPLDIGAITSSGAITATLQESPDNSTWTNLAGNNVSQSTITTASKLVTFEVTSDQLTNRYARLSVQETAGQNVYICCIPFGDEANHKPGNANNSSAVLSQNVVSLS